MNILLYIFHAHQSLKGRRLEMRVEATNNPRHPLDQKGEEIFFFFLIFSFLPGFSTHFSLFQTPKKKKKHTHTQNTRKTHQSLLILHSSLATQGIVLIPNLPFFGSTFRIWGLGVWM